MVIYLDIAAAVMVALFIWLVPVRRNGIPGLRGRGKLPPGGLDAPGGPDGHGGPDAPDMPGVRPAHPGYVAPRPAPPGEMAGGLAGGHSGGQDERILAELDATWEPGYADQVTAQHESRKKED